MTIIRSPRKERNFTVLSNDVCLDYRLSMKALGLLVRLLARPDNWVTNSESLAREFAMGRDQVRKILSELQEFGYMQLKKTQNELGQWTSIWTVYEESGNYAPEPDNRVLGEPYFGESGPITRTDLTRTNNKQSLSPNPLNTVISNDGFELFWRAYPRKTNKSFAQKVFKKFAFTDELLSQMMNALSNFPFSKDPQYIPHPSTWLNGKRWEDEVASTATSFAGAI